MRSLWTIPRATGFGIMTGIGALLLWPFYPRWPETLEWPFLVLLAITAFCGVSILLITMKDIYTRTRGTLMRRIRIFDIAVGFLLAVPSLFQLEDML